jgi:hypothetical protein
MEELASAPGHVDKSYFPLPIQLQHAETGCSSHCRCGHSRKDRKLHSDIELIYCTLRPLSAIFDVLTPINITTTCRSQWPRGLRRRSAAAGLLRSNLTGSMDVCRECCVFSQIEVSALGFLPTVVCHVIQKPRE